MNHSITQSPSSIQSTTAVKTHNSADQSILSYGLALQIVSDQAPTISEVTL